MCVYIENILLKYFEDPSLQLYPGVKNWTGRAISSKKKRKNNHQKVDKFAYGVKCTCSPLCRATLEVRCTFDHWEESMTTNELQFIVNITQ